LKDIIFIALFGIGVFLWNKYVITRAVKKVVQKNENNNWLADNQNIIIKGFQTFYWIGFIMLIISFLISNF